MEYIDKLLVGNEKLVLGAFSTLSGVFIAGLFNLLIKRLELKNARLIKKIEFISGFQNNQMFEPVINYLSKDLEAMQKVYNLILLDEKQRENTVLDNTHVTQIRAIEARVKALSDDETYELFKKFSLQRIRVGNAVYSESADPYEKLEEAINMASELMKRIYEQAKAISKVK
jgi:hypothetical protein